MGCYFLKFGLLELLHLRPLRPSEGEVTCDYNGRRRVTALSVCMSSGP